MKKIELYNSLTKKKEPFNSIIKGEVGLYTCGPTVYNYAHIGNLRSYIFEDVLKRVLMYNGYKVHHVMNITDVGHLVGDGDMGEDKLEKGSKREGKTAWEIAEFYTTAFFEDLKKLNIIIPKEEDLPRATAYINEQIDLIKILEEKGYVYTIKDGVYFDTSKFKDYTKLSHKDLSTLLEGARVEKNEEKKNATDFALWKFSPVDEKRQMEWKSPWGVGFPGWHVECSAMSKTLLGDQLDIHCGGIDHIDVHHTNEIAQSEAAYEKPFFNFWMHNAFLNISGGKKMAKSAGNFLTLENAILENGYHPLAYRFASLQVHYRKPMEWSEDILDNSQCALNKMNSRLRELKYNLPKYRVSTNDINQEYKKKFLEAINDDLNTPVALAVAQTMLKSKISGEEKITTMLDFDNIFGLDFKDRLERKIDKEFTLDENMDLLVKQREKAREEKNWKESDRLRVEIERLGYTVEDGKDGIRVSKKQI